MDILNRFDVNKGVGIRRQSSVVHDGRAAVTFVRGRHRGAVQRTRNTVKLLTGREGLHAGKNSSRPCSLLTGRRLGAGSDVGGQETDDQQRRDAESESREKNRGAGIAQWLVRQTRD